MRIALLVVVLWFALAMPSKRKAGSSNGETRKRATVEEGTERAEQENDKTPGPRLACRNFKQIQWV